MNIEREYYSSVLDIVFYKCQLVQGNQWYYLRLLCQYTYWYFCLLLYQLLKQQCVNISTMIVFFKQSFQTNHCFLKSPSFCSFLWFLCLSVELIFLLLWSGPLYLWRYSLVLVFTLYDNIVSSLFYLLFA